MIALLWLAQMLARFLPPRVILGCAEACGRLSAHVSPARRVVARNLQWIESARESARPMPRPEDRPSGRPPQGAPDSSARVTPSDVFGAYGRYWGEFVILAARPSRIKQLRIRLEGEANLLEAARRGPVVILTGHLGNWDLGAQVMASRLGNLAVVAEQLRPAALFRYFARIRSRWGLSTLPAEGSGVRLYRHLCRGGHLAMVADRSFGPDACPVQFLGASRELPAAGMELARRAGAALLPSFLFREDGGYVIRFHPSVSDEEDPVQAFARALEKEIVAHPGQWCVLYPLHQPAGRQRHGCPEQPSDRTDRRGELSAGRARLIAGGEKSARRERVRGRVMQPSPGR